MKAGLVVGGNFSAFWLQESVMRLYYAALLADRRRVSAMGYQKALFSFLHVFRL